MGGPILVVMAAGMGSRYGGLKQMDRIGKNGEVLLDYSVFDAIRSGFTKVVFIIRHDIEKDFRELVLARLGSQVNCEIAFQEMDSLVPEDIYKRVTALGRTKPWGTAHALLCAAPCIDAPFAVLNADDFYGREAFAVLGKYLADPASKDAAIVPYKVEPTLSPQGTVTRGVCEIKDGYLTSVNELLAIEKKDGRIFNTNPDGSIRELASDTPVSMNFWGFPPADHFPVQGILRQFPQGFCKPARRGTQGGMLSAPGCGLVYSEGLCQNQGAGSGFPLVWRNLQRRPGSRN